MLGFGLTEYLPYVVYGLAFVVAFAALFYRVEIGILFIASLLPVYNILNKALKSNLPLSSNITDIIFVAMIIGCILRIDPDERPSVGPSPLIKPIVIFSCYTLLSFIIGSSYLGHEFFDPSDLRLAHWKNYMVMPLLYLVTYYGLRERKWQYALLILLFFSFLASDYYFFHSFKWVKHTHYVQKSRIGGTLGNLGPNEWGSLHTIYTLFVIGLFMIDKHTWRRVAYLFLILCNSYSLIYSFSRGSYVGFLVGLLFIGVVRSRKLALLLVVFLLFWKSFVPLSVQERIEGTLVEQEVQSEVVKIGGEQVETAGRIELWKAAITYFANNPILGTGYNTYHHLSGMDTHNVYLKTMAEQGIIGIIIYIWLYGLAIKSGWTLYRRADQELVKAFGFGFLCAVVGSIVVNFFGDRWTYLQLGGIYWIFWGLVDQENSRLAGGVKDVSPPMAKPVNGHSP